MRDLLSAAFVALVVVATFRPPLLPVTYSVGHVLLRPLTRWT